MILVTTIWSGLVERFIRLVIFFFLMTATRVLELKLNEPSDPLLRRHPDKPIEEFNCRGMIYRIINPCKIDYSKEEHAEPRKLLADFYQKRSTILLAMNHDLGIYEPLATHLSVDIHVAKEHAALYKRLESGSRVPGLVYARLDFIEEVRLMGPMDKHYRKMLDNSENRREIIIADAVWFDVLTSARKEWEDDGADMLFFMLTIDTNAKYPLCAKVFPALSVFPPQSKQG